MKNLLTLVLTLIIASPVFSREYIEGRDYYVLPTIHKSVPDVIEFISFNCPHCYYVEHKTNIDKHIIASIPTGATFQQYHASILPPLGKELTKAWIISQHTRKSEKIKGALFEVIHNNKNNLSVTDIQQVLIDNGISKDEMFNLWNNTEISNEVKEADKLSQDINLRSVPSWYVKGRFLINNRAMNTTNDKTFEKDISDLIYYLLNTPLSEKTTLEQK